MPDTFGAVYGSTKHAVYGLIRSLDSELVLKNQNDFIKTTTMYPYFIQTNKIIQDNFDTKKTYVKFMNILISISMLFILSVTQNYHI